MLKRLFLAFLLVPLVELILIFVMAHFLGWIWTLVFTVASSLVGGWLARRSFHGWSNQVRDEWSREGFPVHRLGEGAILITAMAFMVTPGPLTGLLGILFTMPKIRERVSRILVRWAGDKILQRFLR